MTIRMTKTMDTFCQRNAQRGHDYYEYGDGVNDYDEEQGDKDDDEDKNDDKDDDNDDDANISLNRCAAVSTFHPEKEKQTFHFQPTGHDCQRKNMPLKKMRKNCMIFFKNAFASEVAKVERKQLKRGVPQPMS